MQTAVVAAAASAAGGSSSCSYSRRLRRRTNGSRALYNPGKLRWRKGKQGIHAIIFFNTDDGFKAHISKNLP